MRLLLLVSFLLAFGHATAQDVPPIGTATTFDVATWNIEHFGNGNSGPSNDDLQAANVLAVLEQADIDLWAMQELDIQSDFNALVNALGAPYSGTWVADGTSFSIGYGFVYNTDVVQVLEATTVLDNFAFEFAFRPPLLLRANITLPDTTVENVRILNVHAKCCSDQSSYNRRVSASNALKNYVDNFLAIDAPVIVMGDLNDELRSSIFNGETSPYQNFRDDRDDYTFVSYALDLANVPTFCSNLACTSGSTLDHILVTRPLETSYVTNSTRRYDALLTAIPSYVNTTSDHVPVYAQFDFMPLPTSSDPTVAPRVFALDAPFPNPFRGQTTLTFALPTADEIRLEVFDALGRQVATVAEGMRPAGTYEVTFAARDLPPGLYLARLTAGSQTATRRLVHVP